MDEYAILDEPSKSSTSNPPARKHGQNPRSGGETLHELLSEEEKGGTLHELFSEEEKEGTLHEVLSEEEIGGTLHEPLSGEEKGGTLHELLSEEEKETYEKIKQQFKALNRIKDFLLLMLSSPMPISNQANYDNSVRDISNIYTQLRTLEACFISKDMNKHLRRIYRLDVKRRLLRLSTRIEKLLHDPFRDEIESYIPRKMVEQIYKPASMLKKKLGEALPSTSSAPPVEETVLVPQEILQLAICSAVRQISKYIQEKKFQNIRVYGRGERKVLQLLKDNIGYGDTVLHQLSYNQSTSEVQAKILKQMGFRHLISEDKSKLGVELYHILERGNFPLLLDGVDDRINLSEVGIALNTGHGAIVFTTGSHDISRTMKVDVEINMEDHLLAWKLFCEIVGEFVHSSTVQRLAITIFEKCGGHMLVIVLMAKYLKNVTDVQIWEDALHELSSLPYKGIHRIVAKAVVLNWEGMENVSKHCIKYCASHPEGTWFNKDSLVSNWIKNGIILTRDEGNYILEGLTCTFLLEDLGKGTSVLLQKEARDVFLEELTHKMHPLILKRGKPKDEELDSKVEERNTDSDCEEWNASDEEWDFREIHLMDNNLSELPDSPNCPILLRLCLQGNNDLTKIPSSFFEHMPVLQVLDLSYTSIKKLPLSLFQLVELRKLFLRGCELFMDLPPQIGELKNLEELDLYKTEIIHLPTEIGNLEKLKVLKVSFYGYMNGSKKSVQLNQKIPQGAISNLFRLSELCIDVNPDDEQWDAIVEVIVNEVTSLKMLKTLELYMPEATLLDKLRRDSTTLIYPSLLHFRFIVGHHKLRILARVPHEVEAEFNRWDKCLKFVHGENVPNEIQKVLRYATAFFLDRHTSVTKLSEFGIENVKNLKFCILAECNQLQTIVDVEEFYEEGDNDRNEEDDDADEYEYDSDFPEELVLESLQYLNIYYMKNLVSIWKGPIHEGCLSSLKFLELHTCPQLSIIFNPNLLRNLINLEELVLEDCPRVTNLLASLASFNLSSNKFLPNLKRMSLLYLPELVCITCDSVYIAPKLERIGFYSCPKLRLSTKDLSSENLKVIKGERSWWEALKWNESEGGARPEHLDRIFSPINNEEDVMTQLKKYGIYFNIQNKNESLLNSQVR